MTVPAWPSELPLPTQAGYRAVTDDPRLRRAAETGPPGYRRRYSSAARRVALSLMLSRSEKAVFDNFWRNTCAHGSLPFTMPDPVTDGWAALDAGGTPLLTEGGTPILLSASWVCLFGDGLPAESLRGVTFTVSFEVAVMP